MTVMVIIVVRIIMILAKPILILVRISVRTLDMAIGLTLLSITKVLIIKVRKLRLSRHSKNSTNNKIYTNNKNMDNGKQQ